MRNVFNCYGLAVVIGCLSLGTLLMQPESAFAEEDCCPSWLGTCAVTGCIVQSNNSLDQADCIRKRLEFIKAQSTQGAFTMKVIELQSDCNSIWTNPPGSPCLGGYCTIPGGGSRQLEYGDRPAGFPCPE